MGKFLGAVRALIKAMRRTFNFDYTLSWFNDYFATHKENRSRSNGFLPDVYQIWDEVIWLTPEK